MPNFKGFLRAAVLFLLAPTFLTHACTRAAYLGDNGDVITARSMDWKVDVLTNLWIFPRGMQPETGVTNSSTNPNLLIMPNMPRRVARHNCRSSLPSTEKPHVIARRS